MAEQERMAEQITTVVIGIGNILLKDDGAGIHLLHALQETGLPPHFKCVEAGTTALDMLTYFLEYESFVIIDALRGGKKPGTLYKLTPEEAAGLAVHNLSLHDVRIPDVINMAHTFNRFPRVTIYGIEPAEIAYGLEMSEELRAALPKLVTHIRKDLLKEYSG